MWSNHAEAFEDAWNNNSDIRKIVVLRFVQITQEINKNFEYIKIGFQFSIYLTPLSPHDIYVS